MACSGSYSSVFGTNDWESSSCGVLPPGIWGAAVRDENVWAAAEVCLFHWREAAEQRADHRCPICPIKDQTDVRAASSNRFPG